MTTWLKCTAPRPDAASRLICFPHAGGSASFFHAWAEGLPAHEVHAVCYPGRAGRYGEPLPTGLPGLAADIAEAVRPLLDRPVAFLGHSMGAVVAYETARLLEAQGHRIGHLFASGARAPHLPHPEGPDAAELDDDAVADALVALGGTDAELLADPEVRELVLPYVCGDYRMFDAYVHRPGPALRCDVTAIAGDGDPLVPEDRAAAWAALTEGRFTHHTVPGDHFYLVPHPPFALVAALAPGVTPGVG
ncbi:thioesterase II family protein [Streptomyces sp. NPDC093598]|uniref:thioesterase II family protein n=1 Tax=Streptomyces sp. NPDC093598 TaxID=3366046 RepID=UPI0038056975